MSKTFLTQCPHCTTRFRVNSNQLFAAQGAVRCGSCMQVFNARLFLEQDTEPFTHTATDAAGTPSDPDLDSLQIHDDMEINLDSPDFEQELARLARQEATESQPPGELAASFPPQHIQTTAQGSDIMLPPAVADNIDEIPVYPEEPGLRAGDFGEPDELNEETPHSPPKHTELRQEPSLDADSFAAIGDEPLRLEWQPEHKSKGTWLWFLLSLLAALGLLAQYTQYNFDSLARQPATRPWLETACNLFGCRLPERVDTSLIASSNLVVRPHAEFANALSVDAIIYNRASFSQPFPLLQLNFMDDNQQLLASRNFSPQEYLGGELAGRRSMPAQTPIRIALDVLVPDTQAVHYSIKFLSPD